MASSSKNPKDKEPFEVQLVSNEVKQLDLELYLRLHTRMTQDCNGRRCKEMYNRKVGGIGDMDIC